MAEEIEKNLLPLLRFRVRPFKPTNGKMKPEKLTDPDADKVFEWWMVPWLTFEQREEIRWAVVKRIYVIRDSERFFQNFSKEQRFGVKGLTSHVPNVEFAGRMLLENFYWEREARAEPYIRLIERGLFAHNETSFGSPVPDVYRALIKAGDQGKDKPNKWRISEFDKWVRRLIENSGWFFGILEVHESPKDARRVNLQVKAPAKLRVHGFPPKLVISLRAERYQGEVVYRSEADHNGHRLVLHAGDEVMARRDFHRSEVEYRTQDTVIFRGHPTARTWWHDKPWKTDVVVPVDAR